MPFPDQKLLVLIAGTRGVNTNLPPKRQYTVNQKIQNNTILVNFLLINPVKYHMNGKVHILMILTNKENHQQTQIKLKIKEEQIQLLEEHKIRIFSLYQVRSKLMDMILAKLVQQNHTRGTCSLVGSMDQEKEFLLWQANQKKIGRRKSVVTKRIILQFMNIINL